MEKELARNERESYLPLKRHRGIKEHQENAKEVEVIDADNDSIEEPEHPAKSTLSWSCEHCTLINDSKQSLCDACGHHISDRAVSGSNKAVTFESDDDSVTYIPNPNLSSANSKRAKATDYSCHINGSSLFDPHPRSIENGGWIWANNNHSKGEQAKEDIHGLIANFRVLAAKSRVTKDKVLHLAKMHSVTVGKWLIYIKLEQAAEVWGKIRDAMFDGKLGTSAKIAKNAHNGSFVICVYCEDFGNKSDVSICVCQYYCFKFIPIYISLFRCCVCAKLC